MSSKCTVVLRSRDFTVLDFPLHFTRQHLILGRTSTYRFTFRDNFEGYAPANSRYRNHKSIGNIEFGQESVDDSLPQNVQRCIRMADLARLETELSVLLWTVPPLQYERHQHKFSRPQSGQSAPAFARSTDKGLAITGKYTSETNELTHENRITTALSPCFAVCPMAKMVREQYLVAQFWCLHPL